MRVMQAYEKVLKFWLDEVGPEGWYLADEALDARLRASFEDMWIDAREGAFGLWLTAPRSTLAYLILTDQFPRNMFRATSTAFATDPSARAVAKGAIAKGWDLKIAEPERQFFYLPLCHSENLNDQDRAVRLMACRLPQSPANLDHACVHREIIRRFGRFPYRNEALGRATTAEEQDWAQNGGYGAILRSLKRDDHGNRLDR